MDEPTTGLDPQTRQLIWNVIEKLQKTENITVFSDYTLYGRGC